MPNLYVQHRRLPLGLSLILGMAALPVQAVNPVTEITTGDLAPGTLGLGFGWRFGNSPYRGIDDISSKETAQDSDLLPFYFYEGKFLFSHGSTAGLHLFNTGTFSADALLAYRFDRLEPERDPYFDGVNEREQSLDGGLRFSARGSWGKFTATWLTDTLDRHNGEEVDLTYRFQWSLDRWQVSPFASYVYWNKSLSDYYYGVTLPESRDDLPVYRPGASETFRAGVNTTYRVSKRLRLFANLAVDVLDNEITESPLVDGDVLASAMVGLGYNFGNIFDARESGRRDAGRYNRR